MEKKDPLDKRREARQHRLLPPESRRGSMFVQGEGPTPCRRVIIGEAPGRTEIEEGRPFIGKSGQLLRKALRDLGLNDEEDVYITNLVKELPLDENGQIRRPNQEEIDVWYPQHVAEMILVTPSDPPFAKLLLGRTAVTVLGKPGADLGIRLDEFTFTATHPAAFFYKGMNDSDIAVWVENEIRPWVEAVNDV